MSYLALMEQILKSANLKDGRIRTSGFWKKSPIRFNKRHQKPFQPRWSYNLHALPNVLSNINKHLAYNSTPAPPPPPREAWQGYHFSEHWLSKSAFLAIVSQPTRLINNYHDVLFNNSTFFTDDLSDFHALAKKAASSAVLAVKDGSQEVRDALFNIIIALHSSHDDINEATRDILGKMMSKRSADGKQEIITLS